MAQQQLRKTVKKLTDLIPGAVSASLTGTDGIGIAF